MTTADEGHRFGPIYAAFAAAYFLSYLYRTANAVISPDLTRELGLDPAALGLLTGAYLLAFGLMQIPAGMLLDRFGPRRVEPVLLCAAAVGAIAFGLADSLPALVAARALIGVGVCVCLMAPLNALLHIATWRAIFVGLGAATFVVALLIVRRVPDIRHAGNPPGLTAQFAAVGNGSFLAIQGLWAVPWMIDVDGMTRAEAADRLFVLGIVIMAGYLSLGMFSSRLGRRGIAPRHLFASGFAVHAVALGVILVGAPGSYAWWSLYGMGAAVNVLSFTMISAGFAKNLAARANTALNLLMFTGSFVAQWSVGVVVQLARARWGFDVAGRLRLAFAIILALDALALAWFAYGWRRHGVLVRATAPA